MIRNFFSNIWHILEAISEGRRLRVNKQIQEYVKNRI